jgi:hypothetical protein
MQVALNHPPYFCPVSLLRVEISILNKKTAPKAVLLIPLPYAPWILALAPLESGCRAVNGPDPYRHSSWFLNFN